MADDPPPILDPLVELLTGSAADDGAPILMDERTTSRRYDIPVRTLQAQRQRGGGIPYIKIGRSVRYDRRVGDAYLREHTRTSTSDDTARADQP